MRTEFYDEMLQHQLSWKARRLPGIKKPGRWMGKEYDHILPWNERDLALWKDLQRGGAFPLNEYLTDQIKAHTGRGNLLSSWTLCANLYFAFGQDPDGRRVLAAFLARAINPAIESVEELHLEYAEAPPLDPGTLLGERDGSRGSGQTSPDVAFKVRLRNGGAGLVLTEVKWMEHSFYACSARKLLKPAERTEKCDLARVRASPETMCEQQVRLRRKYWTRLAPAFTGWDLPQCPAATAGYQLFRQQALAEGIAASGRYELVVSAVASDARNERLLASLRGAGIQSVAEDWSPLFAGRSTFKTFTHQQWVAFVAAASQRPTWSAAWLEYVADRYGYPAAVPGAAPVAD